MVSGAMLFASKIQIYDFLRAHLSTEIRVYFCFAQVKCLLKLGQSLSNPRNLKRLQIKTAMLLEKCSGATITFGC
jgi:hypothetical protein